MNALIVGGGSSIAFYLKPLLSQFFNVYTAGRHDCDLYLDLKSRVSEICFPSNLDVLIHTAASFGGKSPDEMLDALEVNSVGTFKLCQKALEAGVKHFVLISTIFSGLEQNSDFTSAYSITKRHSEEIAEFLCKKNHLPLTILCPSQLYGVGKKFHVHQPFFYSIIEKASRGDDILIYGKNDPKRNFLNVQDLARVILLVIQKRVLGKFFCQNPEDLTYKQLAETAYKVFNKVGRVSFVEGEADIPDNIFPFDKTIYDKIGYWPEVTLVEGIRQIAESKIFSL